MKTVYTKGDVIVNEIKVGDIHYEYDYNMCIKSIVNTKPVRNEDGLWEWKSIHVQPDGEYGNAIDYAVHEKYGHYGPNLYEREAYQGCKFI